MSQLTPFFQVVLESSWQGSLVILLILLVRPLMSASIPARWRYGLWVLVLIRLLVPVSLFPPNPVSLQNLAVMERPLEQLPFVALPFHAMDPDAPHDVPLLATVEPTAPVVSAPANTPTLFSISWWTIAAATWLTGMLVALGILVGAQIMLWRRLGKNGTPVDPAIVAIWNACRRRLHIERGPSLRLSPGVTSPALVGLFRPVLLVPERNFAAFSPDDWENIFVHELAHYRRADPWVHALQLATLALHWFNPLVWYGFRQLRADRELAADEWALQHLNPEQSAAYGETLLKVLMHSSQGDFSLTSVGILEDRVQLKQRLQRIVGFGPRTLFGSLLGLGIVAVAAILVLGRSSEKVDLSNYKDLKPDQILVSAAHRGDIPVMRKMLADGVDINVIADVDGRNTALSDAVARNQQESMRFLVGKGANPNTEAEGVWSPMKAALETGWTECALYLLDHGAACSQGRVAALKGDLNELRTVLAQTPPDLEEWKFLCAVAASNGHADAFRLIMGAIRKQPGNALWQLDDWHVTFPISRDHRDVVQAILDESPYAQKLNQGGVMRLGQVLDENPAMREWLISKGFKIPEYNDGERLVDAAEHQDLPEMERLLKKGTDVNYRGESSWTPITKAAAWGKPNSVKFLLAHGADPNSVHLPGWDYSSLALTSMPEIADMILAAGGNLNATLFKRGVHIMYYSVTFGQTDMVKWFIAHGVDPTKVQADGPDKTFLFDAANPEIAEILIAHGVDVKAKDKEGSTALHQICMFGKDPAETARVLLKHGADPNACDNFGRTPLMEARNGATVEVLVEFGADVHAKTKEGDSLLTAGGGYADPTWMQALIRHGATFDIKTDGPTKLMSAAWRGQIDVMAALLNEGVDPNLKGTWNKAASAYMTPLTAAVVSGNYDATELLINHGARIGKQDMSNALFNRRISIVKLFWEHGAHLISPLTYAVSQGAPVADLEKAVDQESPGELEQDNVSALDEAARLGDLPAVRFLVEKLANIKKAGQPEPKWFRGLEGPLNSAASEGEDEIVAYLLAHGAKPNFADVIAAAGNATPYADERTPDHFEKTVRILLDAGALKGISTEDSAQVLQSGIFTRQGPGNLTVVKMLLGAGLSLDAKSKDGKSSIQAARENSTRTQGAFPPQELMDYLEQVAKK